MKDGFIDGLTEGGPDGGERERLAQFESQAAEFGGAAKAAKAANAASADALRGLIDRVCGAAAEFEAERDAALAALADVEAAAAGKQASTGEEGEGGGSAPPALPPTADEAEAAARLAAEAEAARTLEAQIAAAEAEAASLAAGAAADDAAADALRGEAERLGGGEGDGGGGAAFDAHASAPAAGRLAAAAAWCDEATALVSALAGVELAGVGADGVTLALRPSSDMCDGGGDREGDGPPRSASYELALTFAPGSDTLVGAILSPPDVDLSGAVRAAVAASAAAAAGGRAAAAQPRAPASALVHEALALTSARLRRMELMGEAGAAHALASVSAPPGDLASEVEVVAVLRCGVEVRVRVPPLWPRTGAGGAGGLAILSLTPPQSDTDLSAARARLAGGDLAGGSLCGLLSAAAAACEGVVG